MAERALASAPSAPAAHHHAPRKAWQVWGKRLLTAFFFILVPVLLYMLVKNLDWQEVKHALQSYRLSTLLLGGAIALASYLVYTGFDLLGRYYTRHGLPVLQVIPVAFVCYAFNLNLSSWVGGIALRFRLYSRLGLNTATIAKVLSLSLITNWLGYLLLAGTVFSLRLVRLPSSWQLGTTGLQWIGFLLLAVALAYLLACRFATRREWSWRKLEVSLPTLRLALLQAGLGALNWSLMAALIYLLLPDKAFYPTILGILLISSIAGVITHIPAGLGVLEAVFIALLQHEFSQGTLMAALIGYRALYFLLPLLIACVVYLVLEKRAKALRQKNQ
ncbi:UPF0104 family protein [Pseudomonas sp. UL073]|uniref:UPF0104 family protein n=1 Tax=Zestomonas insulae TaxID=2809017 RepID=A0ABS2IFS6_9GAMM|nr:lysylphosphatidylglycerol synthase domain-containing protein [Pseudomonas insulae]MBM7061900.1 UPF0104 family protein [Pseudomonas insulae]